MIARSLTLVPVLADVVESSRPWFTRSRALLALKRIGDPAAVPALLAAASMADTRDPAVKALAAIGDVRQATARARVQLRRVERDQGSLRESLAQEESAAARWR